MGKTNNLIFFVLMALMLFAGMRLITSNLKAEERGRMQAEINEAQAEVINLQEAYINEIKARLAARYENTVTVTAYCEHEDKTAIGEEPAPGTCAVSENLTKTFPFGSYVRLKGVGVYRVNDVMNGKWQDRVDIFIGDRKAANKFGIKRQAKATAILRG